MRYNYKLLKLALTAIAGCFINFQLQAQTSFHVLNKTTGDTLLTINNDGNLGIGTTDPLARIDARSNDPDVAALLRLSNSDVKYLLRIFSGRLNNPNPFIIWNPGSALRFGTGFNDEYARITDTGNLGIGTDVPMARVHTSLDTYGPHLKCERTGAAPSYYEIYLGENKIIHRSDVDQIFQVDSVDILTAKENGNVAIGSTVATEKLQVHGTVYSDSGGIRFPDGTLQTTAVTGCSPGNTLDQAYDQGGAGAGRK